MSREGQRLPRGKGHRMLKEYRDVLSYAHAKKESAAVVALLEAGIGFSDNYTLYVRRTGNVLPVSTSTTYAPSLAMVGLDLTRFVDNAEEGIVPAPPIAQEHNAKVSNGWHVGSRFILSPEADVVGFVGRNRHGVETVLRTTPKDIVHATRAALARGIVQ